MLILLILTLLKLQWVIKMIYSFNFTVKPNLPDEYLVCLYLQKEVQWKLGQIFCAHVSLFTAYQEQIGLTAWSMSSRNSLCRRTQASISRPFFTFSQYREIRGHHIARLFQCFSIPSVTKIMTQLFCPHFSDRRQIVIFKLHDWNLDKGSYSF